MTKKDIFEYISETPENTNFNILGQMLDEFKNGDSNTVVMKRYIIEGEGATPVTLSQEAFNVLYPFLGAGYHDTGDTGEVGGGCIISYSYDNGEWHGLSAIPDYVGLFHGRDMDDFEKITFLCAPGTKILTLTKFELEGEEVDKSKVKWKILLYKEV